MEEPALKFIDEQYGEQSMESILKDFRERGYAILPGVFERDSVDAYVKQVHAEMFHNGIELQLPDDSPLLIWPAQTPRIRQVLTPALSHSQAQPLPSLYHTIWLIQPVDQPELVPRWHKDREPEGMPGKEYHYPSDVFVGLYFEDMTEECGPTMIIPGSHWDATITPYTDAPQEMILCRKEDAILLDQRTWHRGLPRTAPGIRTLAVFAYYPIPLHYGDVFRMSRAQRRAWLQAKTRKDKAFFGGPFEPPDALRQAEM